MFLLCWVYNKLSSRHLRKDSKEMPNKEEEEKGAEEEEEEEEKC